MIIFMLWRNFIVIIHGFNKKKHSKNSSETQRFKDFYHVMKAEMGLL